MTTSPRGRSPADVEVLSLAPAAVSSGGGVTRVLLSLPARHLRLSRIALDPEDAVFSREVAVAARTEVDGEVREQCSLPAAASTASALAGADRREVLSIPVPVEPLAGRSLVVTIEDGDSPPLSLRRQAAVTLEPVRLRFSGPSGRALRPRGRQPRREAAALRPGRDPRRRQGVPRRARRPRPARAKPRLSAGGTGQRRPGGRRAPSTLAQWRGSRRVLFAGGSVLAIEIPPEVLAARRASPTCGWSPTGASSPTSSSGAAAVRRLVLPLAALAAERDRKVSRWRVALPQQGLPLESVALEAPETVFRRQVTVLDDAPPERGGRAALGGALWERRGQRPGGPLRLALHRAPLGGSLVVEIDDGDNAPLALQECTVGWRTSRLLFKQPGARAVTLLYDNPGVGPPRYDLTLLADELLGGGRGGRHACA